MVVGVLLAGFNLAVIPPQAVNELPKEEDLKPGAVYFIRGSESGGANWKSSRDALVSGTGPITVSEGMLNTWARAQFRPTPSSGTDSLLSIEVLPDPPGFRLTDDKMEISSNVRVNAFGSSFNFLSQARGVMVSKGGRWVFKPERVYLGSCPIPTTGGLAGLVLGRLTNSFAGHEEYVQLAIAWERLRSARVENGLLELQR